MNDEEILRHARDKAYLDSLATSPPFDPDESIRILRRAIEIAHARGDAVAMAEFTIAHAERAESRRHESPLAILVNPHLPPRMARERAWAVAETLQPPERAYALLLMACKLKTIGRRNDAKATLHRLKTRPLPDAADYEPLVALLLAWLEPDFNTHRLSTALVRSHDGVRFYERILSGFKFHKGGMEVASRDKTESSMEDVSMALARAGLMPEAGQAAAQIRKDIPRDRALEVIAITLAQGGFDEQAIEMALRTGERQDALQAVASALAKGGLVLQAQEIAARLKDEVSRGMALSDIASALAKANRISQAKITARQIARHRLRAQALGNVAAAMAEAGRDPNPIFAEAWLSAERICDEYERQEAYRGVSLALARAGLLEQALHAADCIDQQTACIAATADVAVVAEEKGQDPKPFLDRALGLAAQIHDNERRDRAFHAIAVALAKGPSPERAIDVAKKIETWDVRVSALPEIAINLGKRIPVQKWYSVLDPFEDTDGTLHRDIGVALAREGYTEPAMKFAEGWSLEFRRSNEIRAEVAATLAESGGDMAQAFETIGHIWRCRYLCALSPDRVIGDICIAHARGGKGLFSAAAKGARRIADDVLQAHALSAIASGQAGAGEDPSETLEWALEAAERSGDASSRASILRITAVSLAKFGRDAISAFDRAREAASEIGDVFERTEAFLQLALDLIEAKCDPTQAVGQVLALESQIDESRRVRHSNTSTGRLMETLIQRLVEADLLSLADEVVEDDDEYDWALHGRVLMLADAGRFAQARRIADLMRQEGSIRVRAMAGIAIAVGSSGYDPARDLGRLRAAIKRVENPSEQDRANTELFSALVELGRFPEAQAMVDQMAARERKKLVSAMVEKGLFSQALESTGRIDDAELRVDALLEIATALSDVGQDPAPVLDQAWDVAGYGVFEWSEYECKRGDAILRIALTRLKAGLTIEGPGVANWIINGIRSDCQEACNRSAQSCEPGVLPRTGVPGLLWKGGTPPLPEGCNEALGKYAGLLADTGQIDHALDVVSKMDNESERAYALVRVSSALWKSGRDFSGILNEAFRIAARFERDSECGRDRVLAGMAVTMAEAGWSDQAVAMADKIGGEVARLKTLKDVVRLLAEAGRFPEAYNAAVRIQHGQTRANAFGIIAGAQAGAGQLQEACTTLALVPMDMAPDSIWSCRGIREALAELQDSDKARSLLPYYLPVASHVSEIGEVCVLLSRLYPEQQEHLVDFLVKYRDAQKA